jgi:hypothetical protein
MRDDSYVNPFVDVLKKARALRERQAAQAKTEENERKVEQLQAAKDALDKTDQRPAK